MEQSQDLCPLCERPLSEKPSRHHLVPRTFRGRETVNLHMICHIQIHATFTERELLNHYNTIDRILEHENIRKFESWIKKKPPGFYVKKRDTSRKKSR